MLHLYCRKHNNYSYRTIFLETKYVVFEMKWKVRSIFSFDNFSTNSLKSHWCTFQPCRRWKTLTVLKRKGRSSNNFIDDVHCFLKQNKKNRLRMGVFCCNNTNICIVIGKQNCVFGCASLKVNFYFLLNNSLLNTPTLW